MANAVWLLSGHPDRRDRLLSAEYSGIDVATLGVGDRGARRLSGEFRHGQDVADHGEGAVGGLSLRDDVGGGADRGADATGRLGPPRAMARPAASSWRRLTRRPEETFDGSGEADRVLARLRWAFREYRLVLICAAGIWFSDDSRLGLGPSVRQCALRLLLLGPSKNGSDRRQVLLRN